MPRRPSTPTGAPRRAAGPRLPTAGPRRAPMGMLGRPAGGGRVLGTVRQVPNAEIPALHRRPASAQVF